MLRGTRRTERLRKWGAEEQMTEFGCALEAKGQRCGSKGQEGGEEDSSTVRREEFWSNHPGPRPPSSPDARYQVAHSPCLLQPGQAQWIWNLHRMEHFV